VSRSCSRRSTRKLRSLTIFYCCLGSCRSWTLQQTPANNNWSGVCWAPELGLLVAVASSGTGNRVMTSSDGLSWTVRSSPADLGWGSLCWSPQRRQFVAVSNSGARNRVMVSP
jgi:hypothetical protein